MAYANSLLRDRLREQQEAVRKVERDAAAKASAETAAVAAAEQEVRTKEKELMCNAQLSRRLSKTC